MKIQYINNKGAGFSETEEVENGTTIYEFAKSKFDEKLEEVAMEADFTPKNFRIRVNSQPQIASYVLKEGDKVTVTPSNIKGQ